MGRNKDLTPKQAMFIAHYKENGQNATKAAISAGYSEKSAPCQGSQLIKKAKIAKEINSWREIKIEELTRETYIDRAMKDYEQLNVREPNRARFLELSAKLSGHLANNDRPNQTLNMQINVTGGESQLELWELTRKLIGNE